MKHDFQKALNKAIKDVENATTDEEKRKALLRLKGAQVMVGAYLFNPKEMERLS